MKIKFLTLPFDLFDEYIINIDCFRYGYIVGIPFMVFIVTVLSFLIFIWFPLLIIDFFLEHERSNRKH
jgi:hypothetical protein